MLSIGTGFLKNLIWIFLALFGLSIIGGCAGKDATFEQRQQSLSSSLEALRQAKFKGAIRFNEGGSILGFNISNHFSLGPQQVTLMVEGDVDFTTTPRPAGQ